MKPFQFKHFTIEHQKSAMKVGTDGVLLGAWANLGDAKTVLDIGTGSGLIALIAAQRNNKAQITAVELDPNAAQEAAQNFASSPWQNRIHVLEQDINTFNPLICYDHIICNPPFFENNFDEEISSRKLARQQIQFSLQELIQFSQENICPNGLCSFIYPAVEWKRIQYLVSQTKFYINRYCEVLGNPNSAPVRVLVELSLQKGNQILEEQLIIEQGERHNYSEEYRALTRDFYLKF